MNQSMPRVSFFVIRTAMESVRSWVDWASLPSGLSHEAQISELRARLMATIARPEIREAILLASPELDEAIPGWMRDPTTKKGQRVEKALVRYVSRLCGRATPFGLFAGISIGFPGDRTELELGAADSYRRRSRLDMAYLLAFARALCLEPRVRRSLRFRANPDLHPFAGRLRYAEDRTQGRVRSFNLVAVDASEPVLAVLEGAGAGLPLDDLAGLLVDQGASREEAMAFLLEMVDAQLLLPDLAPPVTGAEPLRYLVERCQSLPGAEPMAATLLGVADALARLDRLPLGEVSVYEDLAKALLPMVPGADRKRLFQVDLVKPLSRAVLGKDVIGRAWDGVKVLHGLFGRSSPVDFSSFREAFLRRYEWREVPLAEVMDPEAGIGFPSDFGSPSSGESLLAGLVFPPGREDGFATWSPLTEFLLSKIQESTAQGGQLLRLEERDLEPFFIQNPMPLPTAFSVLVKVAERESGQHQVVFGGALWGPSGANTLGRFCHGNPELTQWVRAHLAEEEALQPEVVFAEVTHLPYDRSGNVVVRPLLRSYEIPYLASSGAEVLNQLPIQDLFVSIRDERVVLRSSRLGKEVLPRLTSAQNHDMRSLPIYRFLCNLQYQGICQPVWDWGGLSGCPFLPRVEVGGTVLAAAFWNIRRPGLDPVIALTGASRMAAFKRWAANLRLPRFVQLVEGDQKWPLDLDNALSVESFLEFVRERGDFRLEECYPGPFDQAVKGPEGPFVHEIIIPMVAPSHTVVSVPEWLSEGRGQGSGGGGPRLYLPGSECLYAKLYTGESGADVLLRELVAPWVQTAMANGFADSWWFIRYGDPDWHLRVRLFGQAAALTGQVLPDLHRRLGPFLKNGLLWKLQLDTYMPETERYGSGVDMTSAHRLFHADSEAVLALLLAYPGDSGRQAIWRLGLLGMDALLDDLGFAFPEKFSLIEMLRATHLQAFQLTDGWQAQLGVRYREERPYLEDLWDRAGSGALSVGKHILQTRTRALEPLRADMELTAAGIRERRAASYLHLFANRLFRSAHRNHEAVLYDFLWRHGRSQTRRTPTGQSAVPILDRSLDHQM